MRHKKKSYLVLLLLSFALLPLVHAEEAGNEEPDILADLSNTSEESAAVPQEELPQVEAPAPTVPAAQQVQAVSPKPPKDLSGKNDITNLEFKVEAGISRVLVSSNTELNYRENHNTGLKQYAYLFQNTTCSQKLQRAYDTTEFVSPVAYFTLLQLPDQKKPVCKLIVQLRENKPPTITSTDRGMYIDFPPSDPKFSSREITSDPNKIVQTENNPYSGDQVYAGKPIDLELKNSDIQDVLRLIGRSSGYNVVVGDDVQGKLGTLSLHGIPWDQAMALVLQSKKLGYVRQGNVLRVATLANIKAERDEAAAAELSQMKAEPIRTVLIPISYATASDLSARVKSLLSDRGTVDTDSRTNTLIIRDIDRVITRAQKLITVLDSQPPRVTVSAKFVEMGQSYLRQFGITNAGGLSFSSTALGLNMSATAQGKPGASPFTANITAPNFARLEANLALGESENMSKVFANPTITITSNQSGKVSLTDARTYFPQSTGTSPVAPVTINADLTLNITPIVSSDGSISMKVDLQQGTFDAKASVPTVISRNIQTNLLVADGDTAVIGGIYKEDKSDSNDGIPFLRKVPILGMFFGGSEFSHSRTEIMIFLTAKITNTEDSFRKAL
jgi:type IV pilus assembly protein PilQ